MVLLGGSKSSRQWNLSYFLLLSVIPDESVSKVRPNDSHKTHTEKEEIDRYFVKVLRSEMFTCYSSGTVVCHLH